MQRSTERLRGGRLVVAAALGLMVFLPGCGKSGPERYRMHGTVTHGGRPVSMGRIIFEPDPSQGNRGPQGFAPIENGRYDTAAPFCQGAVGGPTIVRIEGFEVIAQEEDVTTGGRRLFDTYETRIDLPRETTHYDFDVPASTLR